MAPPKKTKKNNRRGMSKGKRSKGKRSKNKRSKSKRIRNARMVSKKRYTNLLKKKTQKKRMTPKDRKELDRALFVNYCKCIKKIKYTKKTLLHILSLYWFYRILFLICLFVF